MLALLLALQVHLVTTGALARSAHTFIEDAVVSVGTYGPHDQSDSLASATSVGAADLLRVMKVWYGDGIPTELEP